MSTLALARNVSNTTFEDLPGDAVEATKKSILDILGVMFPPTTLVETCASVYELMKEAGGKPESTIIGFGGKAPCWIAAYINGSLTHAIDFDDCVGLENPITHPTGSCFPAALAVAERAGRVSGKELITAVALGNDLDVRLASCPRKSILTDYPFFSITTFGVFAAAAVSAKLLGLSEPEIVNALGLALNRVSGVKEGLFGSDLRAIRDGLSNREGVLCALLAGKGIDSCKNAIELLFKVYYDDDINPQFLTDDLGKRFRGSEVGFKPWPSCLGTHTYLQAVLQAVRDYDIQLEQVDEIIMSGNKWAVDLFTPLEIKQKPTTSITAKTAIPFIVGVALVYRNVTIERFLPENLGDPRVLEIAKKVKYKPDPELGSFSSRVEFKTRDGKTYHTSVDVLRGCIKNPLSVEELTAKFKDCARYARKPLSAGKVDYLVESILNLEKVKNISEITDILG